MFIKLIAFLGFSIALTYPSFAADNIGQIEKTAGKVQSKHFELDV